MKGEYNVLRSQLKGYLFEMVILELLLKSNFQEINVWKEPRERVRENRQGFIELKGRGCWHQIDCACDYRYPIPFSYPIRLLGEVKFRKKPLEKNYIREYIGIIRDIQENYFVADGINIQNVYPRKMEVGVYFSATGFQEEAEKLAYVHGIKTISYANNVKVNRLKMIIEELEENYLSVKCMTREYWNGFCREFKRMIHSGQPNYFFNEDLYMGKNGIALIDMLHQELIEIKSSFMASTATGVFLHFVSDDCFPKELFRNTDERQCRVYYDYDDFGKRFFWMEINGDEKQRRFYFTPPESLDSATLYGSKETLNEKERVFRILNINISLDGIARSLILHLDQDWLDGVRDGLNKLWR